jgi:tripartite-type tricarboxylate transporter receptor subunit TctC
MRFLPLFLACLLSTGPSLAQAQSYQKAMRVILPVSAGSGVDSIVRAFSGALSKTLGQPLVIENLPGAGGVTGTLALVKAPPDGNTIAVISNNHVTNPSVYKNLPYDSLADITPIAMVGSTPFLLVVNPQKVPARNYAELVALLKSKPGEFNYASSGNGTIIHFAGAMFAEEAGVDIHHIPYKGMGPMVTDLLGGQVDLGIVSLPAAQGHLKTGALRAIGLGGARRTPAAPDIPTLAEQGLKGYDVAGWFAVVGPPKLPPAEVKRIHQAVVEAMAMPEVKEAMARQGNDIEVSTPEAATRFIREELDKYARLARKAQMQLD